MPIDGQSERIAVTEADQGANGIANQQSLAFTEREPNNESLEPYLKPKRKPVSLAVLASDQCSIAPFGKPVGKPVAHALHYRYMRGLLLPEL